MFADKELKEAAFFPPVFSAAAVCFGDQHLQTQTAAFVLHLQSLLSDVSLPNWGRIVGYET